MIWFVFFKFWEVNCIFDCVWGGCGGECESGKRFDDGGVEIVSGDCGGGGGRIGEEGYSGGGVFIVV